MIRRLILISTLAARLSTPLWASLPTDVKLVPVFGTESKNKFTTPVGMWEVPGHKGSFVVIEEGNIGVPPAKIWLLAPGTGGYTKTLFCDIPVRKNTSEMGLLGFAFHPDYATNRKYYVSYCPPSPDASYIDERTADATGLKDSGADPHRVLSLDQPFSQRHKGGTIAFGPDKYLYAGFGDGGDDKNAEKRDNLYGKILRLDVSADSGYKIPSDNPFVGVNDTVKGEIWAYGLRNPWKWSFDSETGELWVGDVGESTKEEIDLVKKGENMGWRNLEGKDCIYGAQACAMGQIPPVVDFGRTDAQTIIGGYVYRGLKTSPFYGAYIFGDYKTQLIWALLATKDRTVQEMAVIARPFQGPYSFAMDSDGTIYMVGSGGTIYQLSHPTMDGATRLAPGVAPAAPAAPRARATLFCSSVRAGLCYEYTAPGEPLRRVFNAAGASLEQ